MKKHLLSILTICLTLMFFACSKDEAQPNNPNGEDPTKEQGSDNQSGEVPKGFELTSSQLCEQMKIGWNLGNTLESGIWNGWTGNHMSIETNWGNPKATQELINAVKAAGFNTIRIPVRWYLHADEDMNVKADWMARVKEVVDYAYKQDMFVLLNSHHDEWYDRVDEIAKDDAAICKKLETLWTQIATEFKDYDQKLIFEGFNEVINVSGGEANWGTPSTTMVNFVNLLNKTFVETVRKIEGNKYRTLILQGYACNPDQCMSKIVVPKDVVENRYIVEFHYYQPWDYCSIGEVYTYDKSQFDSKFIKISNYWKKKNIPVVMGEFGAILKYRETQKDKDLATRKQYMKDVVTAAKKYNIVPVYWDNGPSRLPDPDSSDGFYGLFDRNTYEVIDNYALSGMMEGIQ